VEVARRQDVSLRSLLAAVGVGAEIDEEALITADLEIKYAGYFERERAQADRMRNMGEFFLDPDLEYEKMRSLSLEARQKLSNLRPSSLAQASRIPGVSPSDLQNLVIEIERRRRKLMQIQQRISRRRKKDWVGKRLDVLVAGPSEESDLLWEGRTEMHAPEIDGKVYINDFGPYAELSRGQIVRCEIVESHDYDVVARVI